MRILVADDESSLLAVLDQYLKRLGYEVASFRSGKKAWERFEADPGGYALFLSDATLPEMAGHQLLTRMAALNPELRFLIVSGYPFEVATLPQELRARSGFLQKPFTPKMLADAVAGLLKGRP